MALNFPAGPSLGDTHNATNGVSYYYDGTKWKAQGGYTTGTIETVKLDDIDSGFNGSTTTFNLKVSNSTVKPINAQAIFISLAGTIQEPGVAYTVDSVNGTITFASAPAAGTVFFGILHSRLPVDPGLAATVTVGSTTTGNAGTNASVTNSGTNLAATLDFTIPKGDTGATGAAGADGSDGATGATGAAGADGKTVLNGSGAPSGGNNGDFWIDTTNDRIYGPKAGGSWPGSYTSLVGPQGATGATGVTGATGAAGSDGADGSDATVNTTNVNSAGAVMNSDLDGKGELLVGDGSGDPTALAVGTDGYILKADSNEATGVKWATDTNTTYTAGTGLNLSGTEFSVTSLALSTISEAANETAMLALTTQEGDVVVRTDENKSYVKNAGTAGTMADFTLLRTPTDAVLSVNGNTGAITAAQIASAVESASDSNTFTDADHTKLNAIESSATADQTDAEIRAAVESASDSNVFTDADHTKLNGIETSATADQTGAEIKTAYESESDTNAFTDALKTKLDGIATGAEVNVQSDWNASSGDAQILNKPTIPTNTDTTYGISCVDGDNSDEEKIRLTAGGSGSGTDDVVLEAGTGLSIARSGDKITFTNTVTDTNTQLTTEEVQDIIGAMVAGNTETNISVTYDDTNGKLDFVSTDTNTTYSVVTSSANGLAPQLPASHGGKFLKADGTWEVPPDTNTTYSVQDGQLSQNNFTDADHTKLDGIEASADVTDATNVDSAGAVMNSDLDGKGEILIGDGSGDPTALAVGTNNYVLTADSNEATGVKWAAASGGGGSSVLVQDEGSALSTAATTLNFVGSGVAATGTGATKTITISGGGGTSDLIEIMMFT